MSKVLPLAIAVAMAVTPAFAQQSGGGLVTVNISNVANDIARDLDVNVSNIPVTVQVPVSVAANVCNVSIDVLLTGDYPGDGKPKPVVFPDPAVIATRGEECKQRGIVEISPTGTFR